MLSFVVGSLFYIAVGETTTKEALPRLFISAGEMNNL
jgi:hypothetical protein